MKLILLAFGLVLLAVQSSAQAFRMNEVMSSNGGALTDLDGDTPDWIEFCNAGPTSVNLKGYGLSDKKSDLFQWIFPDFSVNPGEYLLVYASGKDRREAPGYWNTVISKNDDWKYLVPVAEPATNWRFNDFNDASWPTGKSGFGFGDGDDYTKIPTNSASVFLRKKFTVDDPSAIQQLVLHLDYDDGFVAYLNGREIARDQMVGKGDFPGFDALASGQHEALIYQSKTPEKFTVPNPAEVLKSGENVLAIQVHNVFTASADFSAIPFLSFGTVTQAANPRIISTLNLQTNELHTNFKISADGESLYLTSAAGQHVDSVRLGVLSLNSSYGRILKNPAEWAVFATSTPRKENSGTEYSGEKPPKPVFSQPAGIIASPIKLVLSTPGKNDSIFYTLDGSEPSRQSLVYTGEININTSKVVRARILKSGLLPGETVTSSYLMHDNRKLALVSVSMNPTDLWDYNTGIYVKGPYAETAKPYKGANFWMDWEKACHFELFETTGNKVIDVDAGTKIYGNYSRANPQKSMAFYCRKGYGAESMKHKIFRERPLDEFKDIVLRNSGNDWNITMFRDALMTGLTIGLNVDQQAYRPAAIYLNGEYWGLLNIREKINEYFIAANHDVDAGEVQLLEGNGLPVFGSEDDWWKMYTFIEQNTLNIQANYDQVEKQIDIGNFIDYFASQIYFRNHDWPGNNIKYWKTTDPASRWRWIAFDTDFGMGIWNSQPSDNTLALATATNGPNWPNPPWSTLLFRRLLENTGFRDQFVNRFADLLNSTFLPDRVIRAIDLKSGVISEEMTRHLQRWNGGTPGNWLTNVQVMRNFATGRPTNVMLHIQTKFGFQNPQILTARADSTQGYIQLNSLKLNAFPWMGNYFPDVPVTLTAIPLAGFRFVQWTGIASGSNSATITVVPQANLDLTAIFENDGSHYEDVVINEISFNNEAPVNPGDWIELYNKGSYDIDISGWKLTDSDPGHQFVFAANTWIKAKSYLVVASDLAKMKTVFGPVKNLIEPFTFTFGLANTVDAVKLYSRDAQLIDEVNYANDEPWQSFSLAELWSLELIDPGKNNNSGRNWILSEKEGTPGLHNRLYIPVGLAGLPVTRPATELLQNYPNPFSEGTSFEFKLNKPGKYSISILDVNGKIIRQMIGNSSLSATQRLYWDGRGETGKPVASGVYFYRLECDGFSEMKRMVKL